MLVLSCAPSGRPSRAVVAWGAAILATSLFAFGGPTSLWRYERMDAHRFTAMAMLTGSLQLRHGLRGLGLDEEVYNGATYTHWGLGVPLLQLPFQAACRLVRPGHPFFPDRAIFAAYLFGTVALVWTAAVRLVRAWLPRASASRQVTLAAAAVWLLLTLALFPVTCWRFDIYEETVAYFALTQLCALSAYVFIALGGSPAVAAALGLAAGVGLLTRPTGTVLAGAWAAALALKSTRRHLGAFAAALAPLVGAFMAFNIARTGSPFNLGFANSNPGNDFHQAGQRFGSACVDTAWHQAQVAWRLFVGLFFYAPPLGTGWMRACYFNFSWRGAGAEPLFGPTAPLVLVAALFCLHVAIRRRRIELLVPLGACTLLFALYVRAGSSFAWRYIVDFYPMVALAAVQVVRASPPPRRVGLLSAVCALLGAVNFVRYVEPWKAPSSKPWMLDARQEEALLSRFEAQRWGTDPPRPARLECPSPDTDREPFQQRQGWSPDCRVGTFTNFYLGVPPAAGVDYTLRLVTDGMPTPQTLRLYFNGAYVAARRSGNVYQAPVRLGRSAMTSPTVMATIQWTAGIEAPAGRLLSVELQ